MSFNSRELWQKRFEAYTTELIRYMRYMFNDHLLFVLVIGVGAGIFYYAGWVKTIQETFPAIPLMVTLLTIAVVISPIITLLKEPDIVYLIVKETEMQDYFKRAKRISFWMQLYLYIVILAVAMPMYVGVTHRSYFHFFLLLVSIGAIKLWNVYTNWESMKLDNSDTTWMFARVVISALLIYLLLAFSFYWTIPLTIIVLGLSYWGLKKRTEGIILRWEILIDKEQGRMNRFYRLVNLFTDVPHLKGTVRRRAYLDFLYRPIPYANRKTYAYLWSRTFVRINEFSGLYLRLTVVAVILLIFLSGFYLTIVFSLLFLYLTGFQFIPMIKHFDGQIMQRLYPITEAVKKRSYIHLLRILLLAQAILFSLIGIAQNGSVGGLWILIINVGFVAAFTFLYVPYRLKKME
ncbi:ABC transporter permease [Listeria grayi]|uniref:Bacterial ABC transporter protein EcsB n=1 Tax=Listeria grayi DSM 20601 TaxID=525367 RepID=D7UZS1_LISGR|nr:ABC transporter permease [Listeria grayi]EFI82916.1 bacterial ABC transporter protein EcsB [Listeria grayi DSM 20601]